LECRLLLRWWRKGIIEPIDIPLFSQPIFIIISPFLGEIVIVLIHFAHVEPGELVESHLDLFPPLMSATFGRTEKLPSSFVGIVELDDEFLLFGAAMLNRNKRVRRFGLWEVCGGTER
jgi:hypothetical protein